MNGFQKVVPRCCHNVVPRRRYNVEKCPHFDVATTSCHDVATTLSRRCNNVVTTLFCYLGNSSDPLAGLQHK